MKLVKPLTYEESICLLINGICGANPTMISRGTGISRVSIDSWLRGEHRSEKTTSIIASWLWREINRHVLLGKDELPTGYE